MEVIRPQTDFSEGKGDGESQSQAVKVAVDVLMELVVRKGLVSSRELEKAILKKMKSKSDML